ncbi:uteroglobin [Macrotis lagotis]|uniref:uteroglobin n=1 Tax=Macrotis lagotis TaxID=92651 RepID=UPI003D69CAC7
MDVNGVRAFLEEAGGRASSDLCPSFFQVCETLLMGTPENHLATIDCFSPDSDMRTVAKQLKERVDELTDRNKKNVRRLMTPDPKLFTLTVHTVSKLVLAPHPICIEGCSLPVGVAHTTVETPPGI